MEREEEMVTRETASSEVVTKVAEEMAREVVHLAVTKEAVAKEEVKREVVTGVVVVRVEVEKGVAVKETGT